MDDQLLRQALRERLTRKLNDKVPNTVDHESVRQLVERLFHDLEREGLAVPVEDQERVAFQVFHDVFGFGALDPLMQDPEITEIMINGPFRVFVERNGVKSKANVAFEDERELRMVIERLLSLSPGKRLDTSSPLVDLALPDGSRIHVAIPPVVAGGPHVTIRKYVREVKTLDDYVRIGAMDDRIASFLHATVRSRLNVLLAGAAGTGKTTMVEVLSTSVDLEERIVVLEDTLELHFRQPNVVRMLTRTANIEGKGEITITDLFRASLRMRPSRIVLGELRGREVLDYLHALNSGHRGSFGVIHAGTPEESVDRLENLVPYSGVAVPASIVRRQIAHGLDVIVQLEQLPDGSRRVTRVTEVGDVGDDGQVQLRDLFRFVETGRGAGGAIEGRFEATGVVPWFHGKFELAGAPVPQSIYAANG